MNEANFQQLCTELKIEIFRYFTIKELIICSGVCQNWRKVIISTPEFWRNPVFRNIRGVEHFIQLYGRHIRELKLSFHQQLTSKECSKIFKACPNLISADLRWCEYIDDTAIMSLAKFCNQLEVLKLTLVSMRGITSLAMGHLANKCPKLEKLSLSECLASVSKADRKHEKSKQNNNSVKEPEPEPEPKRIPKTWGFIYTQIDDSSMALFCKFCSGLKEIYLSGCQNITDVTLEHIGKYCKQIQILDLTYCIKVTNSAIIKLAQQSNLQELYVSTSSLLEDEIETLQNVCAELIIVK